MRYYILSIVLALIFNSNAQRDPLSGMFWNNYAHFNPATSGLKWGHELNVTYRNQWTSISGSPKTIFTNYNTILAEKHGLGVNYSYERIGFADIHRGNVNYNYQFKFDNEDKIAIGIAAGINSFDMESFLIFPEYPNSTEPIFVEGFNGSYFNMNTGIAYSSRKILTGVGLTQLTPQREDGTYALATNLHTHFSYNLPISRKSIFAFGFMGSTDFSFTSLDFSLRYNYIEKLWVGINYRINDNVAANITWDFGKKLKRFRVGYNYELGVSKLSSQSNGTHEVMLGLRIY